VPDASPLVDEDDHALATRLAVEAGHLLMEVRRDAKRRRMEWWQVQEAGDQAAHRFLMDALHDARPRDVVLSEEGADDRRRLSAPRVWIVDPLDGTDQFSDPDRADWAVHVALVVDEQPIAGAVSLPAIDRVWSTSPQPEVPSAAGRKPRIVTSRSRIPYAVLHLAEDLDAELVHLGSAGAKTMTILMGDTDLYVHAGGMYEWDSCAPVAVARAAGLHTSRLDGSPLRYNQPNVWLPDVLIGRTELAEQALSYLQQR
jgi:3'(2'), 5'-bisphosphate nucleotidase